MTPSIAIVGMACVYPDARNPGALWENVLAQRRAFRRMPPDRLRLEDYWSADRAVPDSLYATEAALIEGYEFDRVAYRVAGSTFRAADLAHWLALDVAAKALADAGFADGQGLPRETTGVLLGNSLTGEFSRANLLRLRWPYVRRVLDAALAQQNWDASQRAAFLATVEDQYKSPFPPVGEETLAGGLSNTIAGRICNQFDLKGGGYTVDGACAASLLAAATACSSLAAGDLDLALAGGVDLSLDPFELVGFSKIGALATDEMRVFDRRSAGFWPGEGCGFVVLMRHEDALAQGRRVYAVIRGWGISSDGHGGITRPESEGQLEALRRAYRRAGFGPDTVTYCEGHGTGTTVGDATELEVLTRARREARPDAPPAFLGSVKANLGHTKAAAGMAGLLKATMAVHTQVLPPTTGCGQPHPLVSGPSAALRVLREPEVWPMDRPLRASVSAMGFGGINAHLVLEGVVAGRRATLSPRERVLARSSQDAELFLLAGQRRADLLAQVDRLLPLAGRVSRAELADLAARLAKDLVPGTHRAAVVASKPAELEKRLRTLQSWLQTGAVPLTRPSGALSPIAGEGGSEAAARLGFAEGVFLGSGTGAPRIAFLFPGQGSPTHLDGGAWRRRFAAVRALYERAALPEDGDTVSTRVVQPAVVTASLAGLAVLAEFGVAADAALGHSLGEITALHWAGAFDEATLRRIARVRGAAMAELGSPTGAMLAIEAPWETVQPLLEGRAATIVGYNSPRQTVVAGDAGDVGEVARRAAARGLRATALPVSHAFHTPLVAAAAPALADELAQLSVAGPQARVFSTVTGTLLPPDEDPRELLCRQVTSPVRFLAALNALMGNASSAAVRPRPETHPSGTLCPIGEEGRGEGARRPAEDDVRPPRSAEARRGHEPGGAEFRPVASLLPRPEDQARGETLSSQAHGNSREAGGDAAFLPARGESPAGAPAVDLFIEVGPGQVLSGLARDSVEVPVVALDAGGPSLKGLLEALGAAYVLGAPVRHAALFADRFTRPFDLDWKPKFFVNPCELAPTPREGAEAPSAIASTPGRLALSAGGTDETASTGSAPSSAAADGAAAGGAAPLELIRQLVAERAELPASAVQDGSRLLSDLHLNSITVGQLVSEAARRLGLPRIAGLTDFADASVAEIARALDELKRTGRGVHQDDRRRQPPGVDVWIRSFAVELVEAARPAVARPRAADGGAAGHWQVFATPEHPLAPALRERLAQTGLDGVLLCLPAQPDESVIPLLLEAARAALARKDDARFVLAQHGWGAAGLVRTLQLEAPGLTACVVNVPPERPEAADWIAAEVAVARGYAEAHYDAQGRRFEPRLALADLPAPSASLEGGETAHASTDFPTPTTGMPLGPDDVLLVTGGGKGIAAECALALARDTGARLALLGRSDPNADPELAANLARVRAAGVPCSYVRADVTDARAVRLAVGEAERALGRATALLHAAGTNTPQLLGALDEAAFRRTVAPKLQGARNLLAALDPERLRLFVTFGSIIARAGLRGEADYATANEWMTAFTEAFQARHPRCRCVAFEWSVWSGVGMGERLGRVEALIAQGITPIPPDGGVRILRETLRRPAGPVAVVVTGRFGEPPALKLPELALPLRRFLERKRAHYPGVELVVDTELSTASDPYLRDHVVHKEKLFPAVLGLEAMAQTAMALMETPTAPSFEAVELARPIAVPERGRTILRLAALRRGPDLVEVCVRCDATDFHVDHFRAFCRFGGGLLGGAARVDVAGAEAPRLALDPARELYGGVLFHEGRFRRVTGYRALRARECVAELAPDDGAPWFGAYLPGELVLGDPGARDAALHAIQACIPHARILPTGIERVLIGRASETGPRLARARQRLRNGNEFVYDLEVATPAGEILERWEGLRLRAVGSVAAPGVWPDPLVAPYVERRLEELLPEAPVKVALSAGGRGVPADTALRRLLGTAARLERRADGKPMVADGGGVSAAHAGALTLAVAAPGNLGCDLEAIAARDPAAWADLLGGEDLQLAQRLARERGEPLDAAATRLWGAREALKKSGAALETPLVLESLTPDGWALLRAGARRVATCVLSVRGADKPLALAVATDGGAALGERLLASAAA